MARLIPLFSQNFASGDWSNRNSDPEIQNYVFTTLGGRKTFNGYGKMVRALCDALVQEEKDQGTLLNSAKYSSQ